MRWGKRLALVLATGGGLGYAPVASGTFGTLPGLLIIWGLSPLWRGHWLWPAAVAFLLALLAIPLCDVAEKHFQRKDDHRIVADEYLTFPIGLLGLPLMPAVVAMAFLTNRLMDIIKPPPARQWQRLPGGWGIVIDDFIAALYSLALNHLGWRLFSDYIMRCDEIIRCYTGL